VKAGGSSSHLLGKAAATPALGKLCHGAGAGGTAAAALAADLQGLSAGPSAGD